MKRRIADAALRVRGFLVPDAGAAALLAVALFSLCKGFALSPHPYAYSQYLYTYEHGFLIRGLMGQVAHLLFGDDYGALRVAVDVLSAVSVAALVLGLFALFRWRYDTGPVARLVFLLVASGPLFVTLGATRGYHDAPMLGMGLIAYVLYGARRYLAAFACLTLGVLIHELVVMYVLPLFAVDLLDRGGARTETLRRGGVILAVALVTCTVVWQGRATDAQYDHLVGALERSEPVLGEGWDGYLRWGPFAAGNSVGATAKTYRLKQLVWKKKVRPYLMANLAVLLLVPGILVRRREYGRAAVYAGILLAPHAAYLFAWDLNRLMSLATFTGLVAGMHVASTSRVAAGRWLTVPVLVFTLIQLATRYDVVDQYARGATLLSPPIRFLTF